MFWGSRQIDRQVNGRTEEHNLEPNHSEPKSWEPDGHVPGVSNPDGTPWLPIH